MASACNFWERDDFPKWDFEEVRKQPDYHHAKDDPVYTMAKSNPTMQEFDRFITEGVFQKQTTEKRKPWKCCICQEEFLKLESMTRHNQTRHKKEELKWIIWPCFFKRGNAECMRCHKTLSFKRKKNHHCKHHRRRKFKDLARFECTCGDGFDSYAKAAIHVLTCKYFPGDLGASAEIGSDDESNSSGPSYSDISTEYTSDPDFADLKFSCWFSSSDDEEHDKSGLFKCPMCGYCASYKKCDDHRHFGHRILSKTSFGAYVLLDKVSKSFEHFPEVKK